MATIGRYRSFGIIAALATAITALHDAAIALARSIGDFIALAFAWLAPEPMRLDLGGYVDFVPSGAPLDAALQHDMRHEANVSRRSAARHI